MTHAELVQRAYRWLTSSMGCKVAFAELVTMQPIIPDVIGWRNGGRACHVVECKVTRSDFLADRKKLIHRPDYAMGDYRWYVTPPNLVVPNELPTGWGLVYADRRMLTQVKAVYQSPPSKRFEIGMMHSALRRYGLGVPFYTDTGKFQPISLEPKP